MTQTFLTLESLTQIDKEITKYPSNQKQSAVMAALRIAQVEHGWLSTPVMDFVAEYLGMPAIAVYEVATFYNMYEVKPVGKHKIMLCTNLSCTLMGADKIGEQLKQKLGIEFGETTDDGKFTLKEGECFGACGDAPVFIINNHKMCGFLTPEKVDQILAELE